MQVLYGFALGVFTGVGWVVVHAWVVQRYIVDLVVDSFLGRLFMLVDTSGVVNVGLVEYRFYTSLKAKKKRG